jgi:hypothetical protein
MISLNVKFSSRQNYVYIFTFLNQTMCQIHLCSLGLILLTTEGKFMRYKVCHYGWFTNPSEVTSLLQIFFHSIWLQIISLIQSKNYVCEKQMHL